VGLKRERREEKNIKISLHFPLFLDFHIPFFGGSSRIERKVILHDMEFFSGFLLIWKDAIESFNLAE